MEFDASLCEGCPIDGEYEPATPTGNPDAPYLIVTDKPSRAGIKAGRALPPEQEKLFAKHMSNEGFGKDDFRYVPFCLCPYNTDQYPNKVKTAIHKHCRRHLEDYIEGDLPEAILPMGAEPTSQVFGKSTQITKVRGLGHRSAEFGVPVFPLMNPGQAVRFIENEPIFAADAASFGRLVDANLDIAKADEFTTGEYIEVDDLQFLIDMEAEILAFDTEATGLRWYQRGVDVRSYKPELHKGAQYFRPRFQILTMQFTVETGKAYVLVWDHPERPISEERKPKLRNQLRKLLCNPKTLVVGQNLKFDNVALWATEGIRFPIGGDTGMLAAIVNENMREKNLDVLTKIYAPAMAGYADRFNATVNKERMWETPIAKIIPYGGGDTDAAFRVYEALEEEAASDRGNWTHYCNVSIPGLNAMAGLEMRGMYVDTEKALPEFQQYLSDVVEEQRQSLLAQVDRQIKREHVELVTKRDKKKTAVDALSFTRTAFLKDILFEHEKGFRLKPVIFTDSTAKLPDHLKEPSTSSKDHLPFFFEDCPFTFELAEHVKDSRMLSKDVVGFQEKYVVGGMVRPTYRLDVAVTRRTASRDPNGQNFPKRGKKAKMYQRCFVAPKGWVVLQCDLSQAELRIAGDMANDPVIINIYRTGGDIHVSTACIVLGITEDQFEQLTPEQQKDARTKAKAVNFGFLYGMSWRKFIIYAKTQYGVEFSEKEAKRIRNGFFTKYKGLQRWHERTKQFVMEHGYVRSYSRLVRHLPQVWSEEEYIQAEAIRQAINSPVQEFGSTLGVMALGRMDEELDPEYIKVFGFIHDAIYAYVRVEHVDWGLKQLKGFMESNPLKEVFNLDLKVPIVADAAFGFNNGDLFELKGFTLDKPYDFTQLKDKETGKLLVNLPKQVTPPNGGRLRRSQFTLPTDLEDEGVISTKRVRSIRAAQARRPTATADKRQTATAASEPKPTVKRVSRTRPV